jgi:hypothetical protein
MRRFDRARAVLTARSGQLSLLAMGRHSASAAPPNRLFLHRRGRSLLLVGAGQCPKKRD